MQIIDNISPKPPKFVCSPIPTFRTQYEADKYVDQEKKRWHEGYEGLTGRHYAYLTEGSIKLVTGKIIRPIWRDGDEFLFEQHEQAIKDGEDELIVKRREFGLTSIYGGLEPIYNAIVNPGTINLITSADKTRVKNLFRDKTLVMYENLSENMRPSRLQERTGEYLYLGIRDKHGNIKGSNTQIIGLETADSIRNAKSVEGYRAYSIFLDEFFLHPKAIQVLISSQSSVKQGFEKAGHIVMGGSCGLEDKNSKMEGAAQGQKMWYDAQNLGIRNIFLAGTLCVEQFMVNGWSNEEKAKEWILKERDRLEKAEDKSSYWNFIKQYPLTIEEVFEINRQSIMPPEVMENLSKQKVRILEKGNPVGRYNLSEYNGSVKAEPSKTGKYYIFSNPVQNGEYISGTDPIPFGTADKEEGSEYAIVIKERHSETICAYYAERNLDPDIVIDNCIMLQKYYRSLRFPAGAPTMLEMNRGEVAYHTYLNKGYKHLLADRAINLDIEYIDKRRKKGYQYVNKTMVRCNNFFIEYCKHHHDKIYFLRLISETEKWMDENTDLLSAVLGCELYDNELSKIALKRYARPLTKQRPIISKGAWGQSVWKWVDVPTGS